MSPASKLFHDRLNRRAAMLEPELRSALFRGYLRLSSSISDADLEAFIRSPGAERLLGDAITIEEIEVAFAPLSRTVRDGVEAAGRVLARDIPGALRDAPINVMSPTVVDGIRLLNTRVITELSDNVRDTVRDVVERGLAAGLPPSQIARKVRELLELPPKDAQAVDNFRSMLQTKDVEALNRELRDKRFDATIRKAFEGDGLTPEQIDKMVAAYRRQTIANHAETITRTIALDAQRLAQRLTWRAAMERGEIDGARLFRRYSGVLDDKEREEHLLLEGEVVRWDEPYSSGQMYAGEGDFNCRCLDLFFVTTDPTTARKPGAGARGLKPEQLRVAGVLQALGRMAS
jgi:hypothetical protein